MTTAAAITCRISIPAGCHGTRSSASQRPRCARLTSVNVASAFEYGRTFLGARFLGQRVPLVVSIVVTNRCNYSCAYCDRWDGRGYDMTTTDIISMLDEMAAMGTRRLILTGGEPLVRRDIFDIINRAKTHGLRVNLNSNGTLVPRFIDRLQGLNGLTISLDGDRDVHDQIRGEGAFDAVLDAVRAAREFPHIRVRLAATVSRASIGSEDALLDIARREGVDVFFQPAEQEVLGGDHQDNELSSPIGRYRETIDHLLAEKERGAPIANSASALRYLRTWPNGAALPCAGSKLFVRVDYNGRVMICGRMGDYEESHNALDLGFREAFMRLNEARCPTCWCASRVEVNQAFALKPDAIAGLARAT
ncbi:MAG: MoaA/NifB/PqqE/SkfB family radical SAM enzyme [Myxococcota bacterium]|jgi:MoaA/NifB/PqqE/SkfB family radical SAM enzyme